MLQGVFLSSPAKLGGPQAFDELRRYHTRPLQFNWGPKNVHFRKIHFRDANIDAKVFIFFWKFKELPGATFLCLAFFTAVSNNGQKKRSKVQKRRKMTKTIFSLGFFLWVSFFTKNNVFFYQIEDNVS